MTDLATQLEADATAMMQRHGDALVEWNNAYQADLEAFGARLDDAPISDTFKEAIARKLYQLAQKIVEPLA